MRAFYLFGSQRRLCTVVKSCNLKFRDSEVPALSNISKRKIHAGINIIFVFFWGLVSFLLFIVGKWTKKTILKKEKRQ